jgi:small subunit ribosomal protein S8
MYINLLISIKNAAAAEKPSLKVPYTKMDFAIAELLRRYGFLKRVEVKGRAVKRVMELEVAGARPIHEVKFVSKPSVRVYRGYRVLRTVKSGYGLSVLTTPNGIKASHEAKKEKVGGQLLFEIW